MIIFNYQLVRNIGVWGTTGLFFNYIITAKILKLVQPGFGKMAAKEAELEVTVSHDKSYQLLKMRLGRVSQYSL
jgi:hypothetical protein